MPSPSVLVTACGLTLLAGGFAWRAAVTPTPGLRAHEVRVRDNRRHHYLDHTYAELTALLASLRARHATATTPRDRAAVSQRIADIQMSRGLPAEAFREMEIALVSMPDHPPLLLRAALAQSDMGHIDTARRLIARAIQIDPGSLALPIAARLIEERRGTQ